MYFFHTHRLLDLATGTGDIAFEAARYHPEISVVGLDFAPAMLQAAAVKRKALDLEHRIPLAGGDASALPFPEAVFDAVTVGFGIRNMPDRRRVLREMVRVLVPGGKLHILELTTPQGKRFRKWYGIYLQRLLPRLAGWFTPNPEAYRYLAESILHFPSPRELAEEMAQCGLEAITITPLTFGITTLLEGKKGDPGIPASDQD